MSLRLLIGGIIAVVGLLVLLDLFGISFGVHGPFSAAANAVIAGVMIVGGIALASGRSFFTS